MSTIIEKAVETLAARVSSFDGSAKFVIEGEGAIVLDNTGVRASDEETEVTLTASVDTFEGMMSGDVNPTMAFMQGKLKIDGAMGQAMKLAAVLG